jgi:hypothetical protein
MVLGIALTLASLGAQAFGSMKSAQANNEWRRKLMEKSNSLDDVFNRDYNMNYMETSGVKNILAAYGQGIKDINKNVEGRAAMAGSSPEAVIGEREKTNQNYNDFIRKVASGQDQYRQRKEQMYMLRRDNLDNQLMSADMAKASQWDNFMSNSAGLGSAGISADSIQGAGSGKSSSGSGGWLNGLFKKPYKTVGPGE